MQALEQALDEVKALHERILGRPAPDPATLPAVPFPPGVDPIRFALAEVRHLSELWKHVERMPQPAAWIPPADCFATDQDWVVRIELPGVSREDVKVLLVGGEIVVRGERKPPHLGSQRPIAIERPWGPFERRFPLPIGSRANELVAKLAAGLLELRIPLERLDEEREQKIEVD